MRVGFFFFGLVSLVVCYGCGHMNAGTKEILTISRSEAGATKSTAPLKIDFSTQVKPILEARCQPCHFSGGKVYAKMPFDRPETIKTMGTKLFTRIKDENERRLIRDFLAQE
jgi:hypothetical protein